MIISIIAAMDNDRVIGKNNDLPWKLPKELQYVKKVTLGKPIVMGRKNYESIGRPLPGRRNIVLTRDRNLAYPGCEMAYSIEDVMEMCVGEEEVCIFGGEEIYKMFLPLTHRLYLTKINHAFGGDTFFPLINESQWLEKSKEKGITDAENPYEYVYHIYERKN